MKAYQAIARKLLRIHNLENKAVPDHSQASQVRAELDAYIKEHLPSGSGFDNGTTLDDSSNWEKLVFNTAFHHMDQHGGYNGWTNHQVIVTPSLSFDWNLRVTGRDRNGIKEYIESAFSDCLDADIDEYTLKG